MPLPSFEELFRTADARRSRVPVAVAGAADRTVLEAVTEARNRGWADAILVGTREEIVAVAGDANLSLEGFTIVDTSQPGPAAVAEVRAGRAKMLMKGQIATPDLMRAVLDKEVGLRTSRALCQIVMMEITRDQRGFLLSDTGICIRPTLVQKQSILEDMIRVAQALGERQPKVALMAASEKVNEAMPDTLDAAPLMEFAQATANLTAIVEGPLSFDLAYAADAGDKKRVAGEVVGACDAMLFPDLLSANLTVKAIMYTADCRFGGIVQGAACPIVFMSRADTTATRVNSLALATSLFG